MTLSAGMDFGRSPSPPWPVIFVIRQCFFGGGAESVECYDFSVRSGHQELRIRIAGVRVHLCQLGICLPNQWFSKQRWVRKDSELSQQKTNTC